MEKVTEKQHGLLEQLRDRLNPAIEDLGYELYDLEDLQSQGQRILRVSIDHEQGIQLEDCVRIDQILKKLFDEKMTRLKKCIPWRSRHQVFSGS